MKKRVCSLILLVCFLIGLIPVEVYANGIDETFIAESYGVEALTDAMVSVSAVGEEQPETTPFSVNTEEGTVPDGETAPGEEGTVPDGETAPGEEGTVPDDETVPGEEDDFIETEEPSLSEMEQDNALPQADEIAEENTVEATKIIYWGFKDPNGSNRTVIIGATEADILGAGCKKANVYSYNTETGQGNTWRGSGNLVIAIKIVSKISPVTTVKWFSEFQRITTIDGLDNLDTSNVTNMREMFKGCKFISELDLSHFNTSKVTNMNKMFENCSGSTKLDLSNFDTSNVTSMIEMFYNCSVSELDLSSFNTSNVTDMTRMFMLCSIGGDLDLSSFDTGNVTTMEQMFECSKAGKIIFSEKFNTSNVTNMRLMFKKCATNTFGYVDSEGKFNPKFPESFDTSNVTTMYQMFMEYTGLTELDLRGFNINSSALSTISDIISGANGLRTIYMPTVAEEFIPDDLTFTLPRNTYWVVEDEVDITGNPVYYEVNGRTLLWHNECYGDWITTNETHEKYCEVCPKTICATESHEGTWEKVNDYTHKRTCEECGRENVTGAHHWEEGDGWTQHEFTHSRTCEDCGGVVIEAHVWTEWRSVSNELNERNCTICGYVERGEHLWGDWEKVDDYTHKRTCSTCSEEQTRTHDDWDYTKIDGYWHTSICKTCGYDTIGEHQWGAWVDKGNTHERRCLNCGSIETEYHTPGGWISNGDYHWKECTACGKVLDKVEHTSVRGWHIGAEHPNEHWKVCDECGAEFDESDHTSSKGWVTYGNEHWKVCDYCGTKFEQAEHTLSEWLTEGDYHWKECTTCKKVFDQGKHTPSEWETDEDYHWKECTTCKKVLEQAEHISSKTAWETDEKYHWKVCDECGEEFNKAGHAWPVDFEVDDDARWRFCTVCGAEDRRPHTYGELITDIEPTCTEDGSGHRICSGCGHVEEEVIDALGHTSPDGWVTDGDKHWKVCERCGDEFEKADHTLSDWLIDENDHRKECTTCGKVFEQGKHTPSEWKTDDHNHWKVCTTCEVKLNETEHASSEWKTDKDDHWKVCDECGKEFNKAEHTMPKEYEVDDHERWRACTVCGTVERIPHTYGELEVDEPATCTKDGKGHRKCSGCGYVEEEVIKAPGHSWESDYTKDKTNHWHKCKNCDAIADKAAHTWDNGVIYKQPTCTEKGEITYRCLTCRQTKIEEINANGHDYETVWSMDEDNHWHKCKNCDAIADEAAHAWDDGEVTKPATCTENGEMTYQCTVCDHIRTEEIEADGHDYETVWSKDNDNHWHKCKNCDEIADEAAHTWNDGEVTKAPTCTNEGEKFLTCTACGATKTEVVTPLGHDFETAWHSDEDNHWNKCSRCTEIANKSEHAWDNGKVTIEATDDVRGEMTYTCTICEATKTEDIPPKGHTFETEWTSDENEHWHKCSHPTCDRIADKAPHIWDDGKVTTEPTETDKGVKTYTCTVCGRTRTEDIPPKGHTLKEGWSCDLENHWRECETCGSKAYMGPHTWDDGRVITASTCSRKGEMLYTCTVCEATRVEDIAIVGHEFDESEWISDENDHWHKCKNCEEIAYKSSHTWDEGEETKDSTCTENGVKTFTCTVCDHIKTEEIEANGHDYETVWSKDEDNHWYKCKNCDEIADEAAHTWNDGEVTKAPTCTNEGEKFLTCTACGATKTEVVTPLGHDFETAWHSDDDNHWNKCSRCTEIANKSEHAWDNGKVTIAPTENERGERTYICTVCEATKTEGIPATGHTFETEWTSDENEHWHKCTNPTCDGIADKAPHTWDDGKVTTEPTDTDKGVKTYTCTVCGRTRTEDMPPKGHTLKEGWSSDEENHWRECETCGSKAYLGPHTWDDGKVVMEPTCSKKGEMLYTCTVCGRTKTEDIPAKGHTFDSEWISDENDHWHKCTDPTCEEIAYKSSHTWDEGEETKALTCTENGEMTYQCTVCDHTKTEEINADGHDYETVWSKDNDNHWHKCKNCDEIADEAAHTWNDGEVTKAPTCTNEGEKILTCTVCGATKTEVVTALGHDFETAWHRDGDNHWNKCSRCTEIANKSEHAWDNGKVTIEATDDVRGEMLYTCTICEATKTEDIPPKGHEFETEWTSDENEHWHKCSHPTCDRISYKEPHTWDDGEVTTEPTDTDKGVKTYTCTVCGRTRTEDMPPKGHTLKEGWSSDEENHWRECETCGSKAYLGPHTWDDGKVVMDPTCSKKGEMLYTCTVCGRTKTEDIPAKGHTFDSEWISDENDHWHKCTDPTCEEIAYKSSHTWDEGEETKALTCTENGVKTFTCTVCDHTKTEEINADGHDYETVWSKDENNHWHKCKNCDEIADEAAHTWNDGEVTKAATCTENGEKTFTCTVCAQTKTEEIEANGHDYEIVWSKDEDNHWHKCKNCDAIADEAAHTWGNGVITKHPTCTEKGEMTYHCIVCVQTKIEEIEANGHDYETVWSKDNDNHWHKCKNCDEIADEAAHTWDDGEVTKAPTCTEKGEKTFTCTVCGQTKAEVVEALGHTAVFVPEVKATCVTTGILTHWHCDACGMSFADQECKSEMTNVVTPKNANNHQIGQSGWLFNSDNHWTVCMACRQPMSCGMHIYNNGSCVVCGYAQAAIIPVVPDVPVSSDDSESVDEIITVDMPIESGDNAEEVEGDNVNVTDNAPAKSENPKTGITLSVIPAVPAILAIAVKRHKKH